MTMMQWRGPPLTSWMISLWISCMVALLKITGSCCCLLTLKVPRKAFAMKWKKYSWWIHKYFICMFSSSVIKFLFCCYVLKGLYLWCRCVRPPDRSRADIHSWRNLACLHTWTRQGRGRCHTHPHLDTQVHAGNTLWFLKGPECSIVTHANLFFLKSYSGDFMLRYIETQKLKVACMLTMLSNCQDEEKLTLAAVRSCPCLLTAAGVFMPFIAHTHPSVHTRVWHTRISWSSERRADVLT